MVKSKLKRPAALVLAALSLFLSGCTEYVPVKAADGLDWSKDWVSVGGIAGVDTPAGFTPRENNDTLSANGMYYATWSSGEAESFVNEDGDEAEVYDAQVYLLLAGYKEAGKAEESAAEWLDMASQQYAIEETAAETYNGQAFTVITHTFSSETNPYDRGASAFGVYRNYAISVELSCRDTFEGDAKAVLADFLEHCHYAV